MRYVLIVMYCYIKLTVKFVESVESSFVELAMKNIRKRDVRKQFLRRQRSFSEGK
ncbi:hypothetical protein ACSW9K_15920 (plasmid) [Clostridium perfringens]|nr:hypothetical protein [Clostridium perfringens]EGT0697121.1 hypothetical protein [Clostridium perfringens]MDU3774724.1 hypothetical protein [Clostridium perfringens]MDU7977730.1 hypothetical protein [Clostridioides difficile]UBK51338.1 hypothetical protein KLF52_15545 [Clostridium perfringens]